MAISRQDLRKLERLVGRRQATALSRKIEARAQQAARRASRGTGSQRAAPQTEQQIIKDLVTKKRAGWVNEPGKSRSVLVEAKTGCLVLDAKGKATTEPKITLPSKPGIDKAAFLQHLKDPNVENFVPHMYLDRYGNVTVGIGTLLPDADTAKRLPFVERPSGKPADKDYVAIAFDRVKNSGLVNAKAPVFRPLTSIELSEANSELKALADMDDFLGFLSKTYFPEFHTFPVSAKMGHLDLAYTAGARGSRDNYPLFAAAVDRRNWKQAGVEQRTNRAVKRADIVQAWYNQAARQEPFFISHTKCRKPLSQLMK
jgi:hypothetical protein